MMSAVVVALLLAAESHSPHPKWMTGSWGWQNRGEKAIDCGGDHTPTYHANGKYEFMDETGTWRISGNELIETMTDPGGTGDPARRGKPQIRTFKKISSRILEIDGEFPGRMIKCPNG